MTISAFEEATSMSDSPVNPLPSHPACRWRRIRAAIPVIGLVAGLAVAAPLFPSAANALPPRCPDGGPPPCDTVPPTTQPPPMWNTQVLQLDQDPAGLTGAVTAERWWIPGPPVAQAAARTAAHPSPAGIIGLPTPWSPILAGTSSLVNSVFTFPANPLPANAKMALRVREDGSPGSLCRTQPVGPLPPSWTQLHLLVAPPMSEDVTSLNAMVSSFQGPVTGLPTGISMNISSAGLAPLATGLQLRLQGALQVDTFHFNLDYRIVLNLNPANGLDPSVALTVSAPLAGTVGLTWDGPPPANGSAILTYVQAALGSQLRSKVLSTAGPLVNSTVASLHDVRWWTEQGFTLSVRRVAYSTTDMKVYPALCRLG